MHRKKQQHDWVSVSVFSLQSTMEIVNEILCMGTCHLKTDFVTQFEFSIYYLHYLPYRISENFLYLINKTSDPLFISNMLYSVVWKDQPFLNCEAECFRIPK